MNIAEILKDCPKGTKLYSPICGDCEFQEIITGDFIKVLTVARMEMTFAADGVYFLGDGECLLFPSRNKDEREWKTFKSKLGKASEFKPFDKVVVREPYEKWHIDIFERYDNDTPESPYVCMVGAWEYCLPFNEETAKLIGTMNNYHCGEEIY